MEECPWCVRVREIGPINIAHRGASACAPENTLAAFELAFQMGAHAIELDVHLSVDGVRPLRLRDAAGKGTGGRL